MSAKAADTGWINCSECGWGCQIYRYEFEAGDYHDGQMCPDCCVGICRIDWDIFCAPASARIS